MLAVLATVLAATALPAARPAPAWAANDTLVWDIAAGPQYVDPVMGTSAQANVMVVQNVYERLVWYDGPGTQPIPSEPTLSAKKDRCAPVAGSSGAWPERSSRSP